MSLGIGQSLAPKAYKGNDEDTLIPLINIVFLLLIFFMVAGQMSQGLLDKIILPETADHNSVSSKQDIIAINTQGLVTYNHKTMALETFIQEYKASDSLVIQADSSLTAEAISPLFQLVEANPDLTFSLAVLPEKVK